MAEPFKGTAALGTKYWDTKTMNSTSDAKQGMIDSYKRVGLIHFSTLNSINWSTKNIKKIILKFKHGSSGTHNGSDKTFCLCKSNYQSASVTSVGGKDVFGDTLGTFTRACSSNQYVDDLELSSSENTTFFDKVVNYLKSSTTINTFCLYIDDTEHLSGENYSANYLSVTQASIQIEYDEGLLYYGIKNNWTPCLVYYGVNNQWVQVTPYYGTSNSWQQV